MRAEFEVKLNRDSQLRERVELFEQRRPVVGIGARGIVRRLSGNLAHPRDVIADIGVLDTHETAENVA